MQDTRSTEAVRVGTDPDFAARFITWMGEHPEVFDDPTWAEAEQYLFGLVSGAAVFYTDADQGCAIWFTDLIENASARAHVVCWDPALYGQDDVLRSAVEQIMNEYNLERVYFKIPAWLSEPVNAARRLPWLSPEGYLRHVFIKNNRWEDAWLFSVLRHEVNA